MFFLKKKASLEELLPPPPPLPEKEDNSISKETPIKNVLKKPQKVSKTKAKHSTHKPSARKTFRNSKTIENNPIEKPIAATEHHQEIRSAIEEVKTEKKSMFKKIFGKENETAALPSFEAPKNKIELINSMIKNARTSLIKFDTIGAKIGYIEIIKIYNTLDTANKKKVYNDINELYVERKNAEEMKI